MFEFLATQAQLRRAGALLIRNRRDLRVTPTRGRIGGQRGRMAGHLLGHHGYPVGNVHLFAPLRLREPSPGSHDGAQALT